VTANSQEHTKKKPYQKPNLRVYGDVRALTQATGMVSKNADGSKGLKTA